MESVTLIKTKAGPDEIVGSRDGVSELLFSEGPIAGRNRFRWGKYRRQQTKNEGTKLSYCGLEALLPARVPQSADSKMKEQSCHLQSNQQSEKKQNWISANWPRGALIGTDRVRRRITRAAVKWLRKVSI
jgi:hypothetical protein